MRLTAALASLALLLTTARPAAAADQDYLALGDSVAFGYRSGLPLPAYADQASFVGYPERLAQMLGLRLTNAACPGETTTSFVAPSGGDNGCQAYRAAFPLHTSYSGTQLDLAVAFLRAHPDTRLVTIDLGANDLLLLRKACGGSTSCVQRGLPAMLATVGRNLDTIYDRLRGEAHYQNQLVALAYYAEDYRDGSQIGAIGGLDLTIALVTLGDRGLVADGFGAFAAASGRTGGDACAAGLLARLSSGGCDVHPSSAGQDLLARAIRAAIGA